MGYDPSLLMYDVAGQLEDTLLNYVMANRQMQFKEQKFNREQSQIDRQMQFKEQMFNREQSQIEREFDELQNLREAAERRVADDSSREKIYRKEVNRLLVDREKMKQNVTAKTKRSNLIKNEKRGPLEWWAEEVAPWYWPWAETREEKAHRWSGSTPEEINPLDYPEMIINSPVGQRSNSFEDILRNNPTNQETLMNLINQ
jgi:hypothetical protein